MTIYRLRYVFDKKNPSSPVNIELHFTEKIIAEQFHSFMLEILSKTGKKQMTVNCDEISVWDNATAPFIFEIINKQG